MIFRIKKKLHVYVLLHLPHISAPSSVHNMRYAFRIDSLYLVCLFIVAYWGGHAHMVMEEQWATHVDYGNFFT